MVNRLHLFIIFLILTCTGYAQQGKNDSIHFEVGTGFLYSDQSVIPHYLGFNRLGKIESDGFFQVD